MNKEDLKSKIREAFAAGVYPGDWCLKGSTEGDAPFLLEKAFKGKTDWRVLPPELLDLDLGGWGTALGFFSDEAFRFYLPAYLVADIDGKLESSDVADYLANGLAGATKSAPINPKRYGKRTWWDYKGFRFSVFNKEQCSAIAEYLRFKSDLSQFPEANKTAIEQSLESYWEPRSNGLKP